MKEYEDFDPVTAYVPSEKEKAAIKALKAKCLTKDDWNSKADGIASFKKNLHEHMSKEQNGRCAYCRMLVSSGTSFAQREHIVPKDLHPQWTFEPLNLCYACDRCNNSKRDIETLVDENVSAYPTQSEAFKIINPFYDKWSDHIDLVKDLIYVGKTNKGKFTINICNLCRPKLAIDRARTKIEQENPDSVMSLLLNLLSENSSAVKESDKVKKEVADIVKKYKKE